MSELTAYDVEVYYEIQSRGYSVEEAYELFRKNNLPVDLQKIIQAYQDRLKEEAAQ